MKGLNMLSSDKARELVGNHLDSLKHPVLDDVSSYIERTAKMGGRHTNYGVSLDIKPEVLDQFMNSLKTHGYQVESTQDAHLIVVKISW